MATRMTVAVCVALASGCLTEAWAAGILGVSPTPNSAAAGVSVSHPALPGNAIDFRTCETVLDGNQDFGLFRVKLAPPGGSTRLGWFTNRSGLGYEWTYEQGITVRCEVVPSSEMAAVAYTVINRSAVPLQRVHLHTCVTTTDAPAFFPQRLSGAESRLPLETLDQDYTELLTRLFLWSKGRTFPMDTTEYGRTQVHLSLMPEGERPIQWAWWVNSTNTFDEPVIALRSHDGRWTVGLWFERAAWASANTGDDRACFHLFPSFGRIEPGGSATVRGGLCLLRGGLEAFRRRVSDSAFSGISSSSDTPHFREESE